MINCILIRAAVEANTGIRISPEEVRELLLEEGLITPKQYHNDCFTGVDYSSLFEFDSADVSQYSLDLVEGIPL